VNLSESIQYDGDCLKVFSMTVIVW